MTLNPETDSPSSVKVPVLSKIIIETQPATLILGGSMQKIFQRFSYLTAKITPAVIAVGSIGGIAIVIKSKNLLTVETVSRYFIETGIFTSIPMKAIKPNEHANSKESQWNLNFEGLGKRILLTSKPLVVSYPVLVTIPSAFSAPALVLITSVPLNKVCFLSVSGS
jgi:hypothetical protein